MPGAIKSRWIAGKVKCLAHYETPKIFDRYVKVKFNEQMKVV